MKIHVDVQFHHMEAAAALFTRLCGDEKAAKLWLIEQVSTTPLRKYSLDTADPSKAKITIELNHD